LPARLLVSRGRTVSRGNAALRVKIGPVRYESLARGDRSQPRLTRAAPRDKDGFRAARGSRRRERTTVSRQTPDRFRTAS